MVSFALTKWLCPSQCRQDLGLGELLDELGELPATAAAANTGRTVPGPSQPWTTRRDDGPDHLGLRCSAFPQHQMALITSGCCVPFQVLVTSFDNDTWW